MAVEYRDVRPGARVANLRLRSFPLIVETDYWVGGWADGCHSRVLRGTGRAPSAHTLLRIVYFVLTTRRPYQEYAAEYGVASVEARTRRVIAQLQRQGYTVTKAA